MRYMLQPLKKKEAMIIGWPAGKTTNPVITIE